MVQIRIFNDTDHAQSSPFYIKRRQIKTEWGLSRREGERERSGLWEREAEIKGESKMAWVEK